MCTIAAVEADAKIGDRTRWSYSDEPQKQGIAVYHGDTYKLHSTQDTEDTPQMVLQLNIEPSMTRAQARGNRGSDEGKKDIVAPWGVIKTNTYRGGEKYIGIQDGRNIALEMIDENGAKTTKISGKVVRAKTQIVPNQINAKGRIEALQVMLDKGVADRISKEFFQGERFWITRVEVAETYGAGAGLMLIPSVKP